MTEQLYVTGPLGLVGNSATSEEEEIVMPGLVTQAAHPQAEPIEMEDDMPQLTQEEIDEFGDSVEAYGGNKKLVADVGNFPRSGVVTNAAQQRAYSDVSMLVNASGGFDRFKELLAVYVTQQQDPSTRMPLRDTAERVRLIEDVLVNAMISGHGGERSADELRTETTTALASWVKHYANLLPRDYSGNAPAVRAAGSDEQELKEDWGNFFGQAGNPLGPNGSSSPNGGHWESPNNILRKISQQSQNGNGFHHP